jgi:hypothetical protein
VALNCFTDSDYQIHAAAAPSCAGSPTRPGS